MATSVKCHLEWKTISLHSPLVPIRINWLQMEFLALNFGKWSLNISLLYNNCLTDCFIPIQNLPFADMQSCSLSFGKVLWKQIWLLVTEIWPIIFLEIQSLFWGAGNVVYDKTISTISLKLVYEGIKSRLKTLNDLAVILVSLCEFALKLPKIHSWKDPKWW